MFVYYPDPTSYVARQIMKPEHESLPVGTDVNGWIIAHREVHDPPQRGDYIEVRTPYTGSIRTYRYQEG